MSTHHPNGTAPHAAIYCRVSTEDQQERGFSLETQREACLAFAQHTGYTVKDEHIFLEDYSGMVLSRPKLDVLRQLVRQELIQATIVQDLDRLARRLVHKLLLQDELKSASVRLHVVLMPQDDNPTPEQRLLSDVRGIIGEYEHAKLMERTQRGRLGRAQAGFPPANAPLGYCYVKHEKRGGYYVEDPGESAVVRRIFAMYIERGMPMERIAESLTHERIPTKGAHLRRTYSNTVWHQQSIRDILLNETYTGTYFYGKWKRISGKKNPDKNTRWEAVPREQWIPIPVPQLIDEATFHTAKEQIKRNIQTNRRNRKAEYLFIGGRLRCAQCGRCMSGYSAWNSRRAYRCLQPQHHRTIPHIKRGTTADKIEDPVWGAIEEALRNPDTLVKAAEQHKTHASVQEKDIDKQRRFYQKELAKCHRDTKKWEEAYLSDIFTLDEFKTKKADVDTRRVSLEKELERIENQQKHIEQSRIEIASLRAFCKQNVNKLKSLDLAKKREVIEMFNIIVFWHPLHGIEITGNIHVDIKTNASG